MSSGSSGAGNATQTMPAISPSVTVISTASATPRAVTIFYYTDVILISLFLFVVILLSSPSPCSFPDPGAYPNGQTGFYSDTHTFGVVVEPCWSSTTSSCCSLQQRHPSHCIPPRPVDRRHPR
ncbi:hypothetical protein K435DRAFT_857721 [Dendrothele bispora CBS 962.96]|uniref:Uncharacterized protein n=1 Tax=Dendrothele bispora (strain CBS 962.96) TaxID=1314807 RepID=A0A4S8M5P7_DENBC|nr:hypothetical protein K435DRAFT_857721 [Dendrothele bispora CBS 962.96]